MIGAQGVDGDQEDAAGRMEAGGSRRRTDFLLAAAAGDERQKSEPNGAWNQSPSEI